MPFFSHDIYTLKITPTSGCQDGKEQEVGFTLDVTGNPTIGQMNGHFENIFAINVSKQLDYYTHHGESIKYYKSKFNKATAKELEIRIDPDKCHAIKWKIPHMPDIYPLSGNYIALQMTDKTQGTFVVMQNDDSTNPTLTKETSMDDELNTNTQNKSTALLQAIKMKDAPKNR